MSNKDNAGQNPFYALREAETEEYLQQVSRLERLEAELEELRSNYNVGRQYPYRKIAIALVIAAAGTYGMTWWYPAERELLLLIGGTGLFTAVLIYYLTPERFVPASLTEEIVSPMLDNYEDLINELGLEEISIYIPLNNEPDTIDDHRVVLFVPQFEDYTLPGPLSLQTRLVVAKENRQRGLSLRPLSINLVNDFASTLPAGLGNTPQELAAQLLDGLMNDLELIESGTDEVDVDENQAVFTITNPHYTDFLGFDTPIVSFLGIGLAAGLEFPVEVNSRSSLSGEPGDYIVTCEWFPKK